MSTIPKPFIPGVSIIFASNDKSYISAKVVVCCPCLLCSEIVFVFNNKLGSNAFTKVDFPTPECPENMVILSTISSFNLSTPLFWVEETRKHW